MENSNTRLQIQDILRAADVQRWTIVRTKGRTQSLAEHTFSVVMIARAICKEAGLSDDSVIKCALEHDLDEILTSDIPSPTKRAFERAGFDVNLETNGSAKLYHPTTKMIVKLADVLETVTWIENNRLGRHADQVFQNAAAYWRQLITETASKRPNIAVAAERVKIAIDTGRITEL